MKTNFVILVYVFLTSTILSQGITKSIKTTPITLPPDYYAAVIYLNEGPIEWIEEEIQPESEKDPQEHGSVFRVAITLSEIYSGLIIEKVTIGSEGFGRKITYSKRMDTYQFVDSFKISGEFAGLEFVSWEDYRSFKMTIKDRLFLVSNIDMDTLSISEIIKTTE